MEQFAFIIHPLEVEDVSRRIPLAKYLPGGVVEAMLPWLPPFRASRIEGITSPYNEAKGWFIACPLTSRQIMELPLERVLDNIVAAGRLAQGLGAKILGLGAFTSVVGDGGITIAESLEIPVTTGNSYTVATTIQAVRQAAALMEIDLKQAQVLIVGAAGAIGSVCAELLAKEVNRLTLVGRDQDKLDRLARKLLFDTGLTARTTTKLKQVLPGADIIITVTSSLDVLIEPEDLKPGAIVCDVARPRNVSREVAKVRDDVLIIEGGLVEVPGAVNFNLNFGFPPQTCYGCMAETMLLALERKYENFSLGKNLTTGQVEIINRIGIKHGFRVAGFRNFERAVTMEEIGRIKDRAKGHNNNRLCINY